MASLIFLFPIVRWLRLLDSEPVRHQVPSVAPLLDMVMHRVQQTNIQVPCESVCYAVSLAVIKPWIGT